MTDRELLELAAKAAGYTTNGEYLVDRGLWVMQHKPCWGYWNPLIDDGDALRLAVDLDMEVNLNRVDEMTIVCFGYFARESVKEEHNEDPYAATRRAIVRAAAEIGKALK